MCVCNKPLAWLGGSRSIDELRDHLDRIAEPASLGDSWAQELNEAQDLPERHLGLFVVDVTPLRKALLAMCACCRLRLLGVVQRWLEDACAKLKSSLQVKSGEIVMSPKQPDELHSAIEAVKSLDPFLMKITPVLASIRQMFEVLESRFHQVPRALIKRWYECIHAVPDLRDRAEKWRNIFRKDLRGKFNMKIAEKAKVLLAQVEECRLVLEEYACKVSLNKAEFYYNKMNKLQERVAKVQEQVEKQHVHEEMMEMPLSEFPGLAATAEQIAPLLELWYLAHEWIQWKDEILFGEFAWAASSPVKMQPTAKAAHDLHTPRLSRPGFPSHLRITMNGMGFGEQGQQSSQDCSIHICTICRAPIRISYFVGIFFVYELVNIGKQGGSNDDILWQVLRACCNEAVLLLTILCHEFGHGNMARYLGGEISHILLWVFGGICFSTRPRNDSADNTKLLRNDLLIVAAGPSTHFVQAPAWALILWLLFFIITSKGGDTGYDSPWEAVQAAINPLGGYYNPWRSTMGEWTLLAWSVVQSAIQLNVALFIFNVFFPMYPADGAKLMVTSLMFFCGVTPRKASMVLICTSVPCGLLMIAWAVWGLIKAGPSGILGSLMGWMGVMSLMEAWRIWKLRKARQLNTHPLFEVAKSWRRTERDRFGVVHRINQSDFDDDEPLTRGGCWRNLCAVFRGGDSDESPRGACCCCCNFGRRGPEEVEVVPSASPEHQAALRSQRDQFVQRMEQQRIDQSRGVA
ncbi:unnamed protein product [Effrenium voratum]|nr:unnamed protein product [Effrenium voratum]